MVTKAVSRKPAPAGKPAAFKACSACKTPGKCNAMKSCMASGMKYGGKVGKAKG